MSVTVAGAALAAILASAPVESEAALREGERVLGQARYPFCAADTTYVPAGLDWRWCALAQAEQFRGCPGYARVCDQHGDGSGGPFRLESDEAGEPDQDVAYNSPEQREIEPRETPRELGVLAQMLLWGSILGLAIALGFALRRLAVQGRQRPDPDEADPPPDASTSMVAAQAEARRVVETDVARLLARAEAAERRGDYLAAIADVYAALLRRLEGEQAIVVDRWKTNGDYLQALRDRPQLRAEVGAVIREVEEVQFGAAEAEPTRYQRMRAKVLAVVGRATLAVLVASGLSGPLACDAEAPPVTADPDEPEPYLGGLGAEPSGYRAAAELLRAFDIDARHRLRTIDDLTEAQAAIVILDISLRDEHWDQVLTWVEREGGVLMVASLDALPPALGVDYAPLTARDDALLVDPRWLRGHDLGLRLAAPAGRTLALRDDGGDNDNDNDGDNDGEVLLRRPAPEGQQVEGLPYVIRRDHGRGQIIVFAEPDMWRNAGLLVGDNAAFLVNLMREHDVEAVEFVDDFTGIGAKSPAESIRDAQLGPLFIQILLFLALLYAAVGVPFARLRDPATRRRRAFSEHVQTLGQRYAQARATSHVASIYSGWALDHLRERLAPGATSGLLPLAQAIAARTGRREGEVMAVLVEAHELRSQPLREHGHAQSLELMRALAELVEQSGRTS